MIKVALLGSSGHIGQGLIFQFAKDEEIALNLFDIENGKVHDFVKSNKISTRRLKIFALEKFATKDNDVVINCIGAGARAKIKSLGGEIQLLTEKYDNIIIDYLKKKPSRRYIYLSSGIVYGGCGPFKKDSQLKLAVNDLSSPYQMAKLNAETKHRSFGNLNIVDIRIFSYFSRFIDLESGFLVSDMVRSIKNRKKFLTDKTDFGRDFIDCEDLAQLIKLCFKQRKINRAFDAYSAEPTTKVQLMVFFAKKYGLAVKYSRIESANPTGAKQKYYSLNREAAKIGYKPKYSAIESIDKEVSIIMQNK